METHASTIPSPRPTWNTDGISATSSRRFNAPERDAYQNATFSGRFGWTPSDSLSIDYVFRYADADKEIDGFFTDEEHRDNRLQQFFQNVELQSMASRGLIEQKVGFGLTDYQQLDSSPGPFDTPQFAGDSRQLYYQANLLLTDSNTLSAGVDYLHEQAVSTNRSQQSQNLRGVYLQDSLRLVEGFVIERTTKRRLASGRLASRPTPPLTTVGEDAGSSSSPSAWSSFC